MKYLSVFVVSLTLFLTDTALASAPATVFTQNTAQEKAASLRVQLSDVEAKQAELQTRLQNLDEKLKPENIESALAGVGSTRPEDLREQRRRQLEIERNAVQRQLDLLNTSHIRLETAIATADAEAYRQSAAPPRGPALNPSITSADATAAPAAAAPARSRRTRKKRVRKSRRINPAVKPNGAVQ